MDAIHFFKGYFLIIDTTHSPLLHGNMIKRAIDIAKKGTKIISDDSKARIYTVDDNQLSL